MSKGPDSGGPRGPDRIRPASPSPRGPDTEPVSGRGGAYSAPPPADSSGGGPGKGKRPTPWWLLGAVAVVLVGGMLYQGNVGGAPTPPPAVEQTTSAAVTVLALGTADIDQPATDLAKALIAGGTLPAPPKGPPAATPPAGATAPTDAPAAAPTPDVAPPAAATPQPAPVVHRPKPAPDAPKPAAPAPAPVAETEQAVRQMLAQAPEETRAGIADGRQVIYSLHVLDDIAEDGDIVEIFVNGTSYGRVLLSNAGQDVLIPLPANTNAQVHVLAVQDGGGGVTFGVTTSQGEIRSTVMPEGGSDDWSVTIQ